jgi:hypothetical protein
MFEGLYPKYHDVLDMRSARFGRIIGLTAGLVLGLALAGSMAEKQGRAVRYYFDRSRVMDWAFADDRPTIAVDDPPAADPADPVVHPENGDKLPPAADKRSASLRIWSSRVFR